MTVVDYSPARFESHACGENGGFWDPRNGGECWSCPTGYERTGETVTSGRACGEIPMDFKPASVVLAACKGFGQNAFFDFIDNGSCWKCPPGYRRTLDSVKSANACENPGLDWKVGTFTDPGLFGLRGMDIIAAKALDDAASRDALMKSMAQLAGEPFDAFQNRTWQALVDDPAGSMFLQMLTLQRLVKIGENPQTVDPDERQGLKSFEEYIRARKLFLMENALGALDNWQAAEQIKRGLRNKGRLTMLVDYGTVPPDFNQILAEGALDSQGFQLPVSVLGSALVGAGVKFAGTQIFPHLSNAAGKIGTKLAANEIKRLASNAVSKTAIQFSDEALERITAKLAKSVTQKFGDQLARQFGKQVLSKMLTTSASGAAAVAAIMGVIIDLNIDTIQKIVEARPKIERAIIGVKREHYDIRHMLMDDARANQIQLYWAMAVTGGTPAPKGFVAHVMKISPVAVKAPTGIPNTPPAPVTNANLLQAPEGKKYLDDPIAGLMAKPRKIRAVDTSMCLAPIGPMAPFTLTPCDKAPTFTADRKNGGRLIAQDIRSYLSESGVAILETLPGLRRNPAGIRKSAFPKKAPAKTQNGNVVIQNIRIAGATGPIQLTLKDGKCLGRAIDKQGVPLPGLACADLPKTVWEILY